MLLAVSINKVRATTPDTYAELEVKNPHSDEWLGRPTEAYVEQVRAFHPGTVRIKVVDGPLIGWSATAVTYARAGVADVTIVGESAFA